MNLQKCARCKKLPAMVFITRLENGKTINEGLCLKCAGEIGIKPVNDMLTKMGISEEEIQSMSEQMDSIMDGVDTGLVEAFDDDNNVKLPTLNFSEMFGITPKQKKKEQSSNDAKNKESTHKMLSLYCTNLNEKAQSGKIDRIVGREREIDRIIQILMRRQKNNPCLIGEPGVGKTAIAEELAQRIVDKNVPEALADTEIWLMDLTALVAGTQFRGQFESRILALLKEVKAAGNIILMIDEVHNIAGAGETSDGSMSAANILKPALSRGEIRVIGATTLKEYRKYIEKDSALERRFQPVKVDEPSVNDTIEIIKGVKKYYEKYHGISINDSVAKAAAILSERYITDRFLPDKAIDLIDEACSKKALSSTELNEKLRLERNAVDIEGKIKSLEGELESVDGQTEANYKLLADLKVDKHRIDNRLDEIKPIIENLSLDVNDLRKVIEIWTGIPAAEIDIGDVGMLNNLYERLSSKVIGQDEAVSAVVRAIRRKRSGVSWNKSPVSMIFAGPTGVGKTELVRVLANDLFKQPEALIRLDMSEFMEKHSVSRIIGSPPGYVGYDEAGQLTEKIRRRPYSVVLFDEIEKAHPDVLNILLQVLDEGRITDAQGRHVNFENTIIIMTTNAGSENSNSISGFSNMPDLRDKDRVEKALSSFLRPEFINRVDEIIAFRHLNKQDFAKIAAIMLEKLKAHLEEKEIKFVYSDECLTYIAEHSYSEKFGARNMLRYIERNVEDVIANLIIEKHQDVIAGISLTVKEDSLAVDSI